METVVSTTGVVLDKPWYLSKKVWLAAIAFALVVFQQYTGKWGSLTPEQLAAQIAATATLISPILGLILSIAHVDANTRAAAIAADATLAGLNKPDAPEVKS